MQRKPLAWLLRKLDLVLVLHCYEHDSYKHVDKDVNFRNAGDFRAKQHAPELKIH